MFSAPSYSWNMSIIRAFPAAPRMLAAALVALVGQRAAAQCPEGTPPPCKGGRPSIARPAPLHLNPRNWVVVPFTNATRAPDVDWLRDASVNLLSLDLGRWNDITVVPEERVGDLVRELSTGGSAPPLTLNDGLSIARRAGAGRLVMGDFFKVGRTMRLVATVFDVARGARIRSVTQTAADQDSLLTAFAPLARGEAWTAGALT